MDIRRMARPAALLLAGLALLGGAVVFVVTRPTEVPLILDYFLSLQE